MIEYLLANGQPETTPFWSRTLLQPLAPSPLTPFSASMLVEIAGRAWYGYFDRLGFEPTPKARIVRLHAGRPYVNLILSADLDARHAGREPVAVRLAGRELPLTPWSKPGFLAAMKLGRNARKIDETLATLEAEVTQAQVKGRTWLQKVQGLRWSQAEILQIMEEIERVGAASLMPFFAARHNLEYAYGRLLMLVEPTPFPQRVALVNRALAGVTATVEMELARQVLRLGRLAAAGTPERTWLDAFLASGGDIAAAPGALAGPLQDLMATYGHRSAGEGELFHPRWYEMPAPLLHAVRAAAVAGAEPVGDQATAATEALLAAIAGAHRKEAQQWLAHLRGWLPLQSQALHAYAYVLAGTRHWALAAGREAMGDGRLLAEEDVFFYELEEVKEMMTGEWNVSDREAIQAAAAERRARWAAAQGQAAAPLLAGDQEVTVAAPGLPGAPGQARGRAATTLAAVDGEGRAILAPLQPDTGWAAGLPAAAGLATAQGALLDPTVVAAAIWGIPVVYEVGADLAACPPGATLMVDGDRGQVTIG